MEALQVAFGLLAELLSPHSCRTPSYEHALLSDTELVEQAGGEPLRPRSLPTDPPGDSGLSNAELLSGSGETEALTTAQD